MNDNIGTIKLNNFGTPMKIIAYRNCTDMDIEFLDEYHYVKRNVAMVNFTKGTIKNPFDRTLQGVGYIGVGDFLAKENGKTTVEYDCWTHMINRCYAEKYKHLNGSYYGISIVCEEWKNFQYFAEWYQRNSYNVNERLHIDKDILYPGNKIYSPYHCLLVPQRINMLFTNKPNKRGLPNGITKKGDWYYAKYNTKDIGQSQTLEGAYELYARCKKEEIVRIANEYKDIVPQGVYDALLNYEVRIENDKNY